MAAVKTPRGGGGGISLTIRLFFCLGLGLALFHCVTGEEYKDWHTCEGVFSYACSDETVNDEASHEPEKVKQQKDIAANKENAKKCKSGRCRYYKCNAKAVCFPKYKDGKQCKNGENPITGEDWASTKKFYENPSAASWKQGIINDGKKTEKDHADRCESEKCKFDYEKAKEAICEPKSKSDPDPAKPPKTPDKNTKGNGSSGSIIQAMFSLTSAAVLVGIWLSEMVVFQYIQGQ